MRNIFVKLFKFEPDFQEEMSFKIHVFLFCSGGHFV